MVYVFCLNVPEIALPLVLVTQLHASPVWPAAVFVANTVLVVTLQVPVTVLMSRFSRRTVLALSGVVLAVLYLGFLAATSLEHGWGAPAVATVSVVCTIGEIVYAGSATALVTALAPAHVLGRVLARFELSTGFGLAVSPAVITAPAPHGLWGSLAAATLVSGFSWAEPGTAGRIGLMSVVPLSHPTETAFSPPTGTDFAFPQPWPPARFPSLNRRRHGPPRHRGRDHDVVRLREARRAAGRATAAVRTGRSAGRAVPLFAYAERFFLSRAFLFEARLGYRKLNLVCATCRRRNGVSGSTVALEYSSGTLSSQLCQGYLPSGRGAGFHGVVIKNFPCSAGVRPGRGHRCKVCARCRV